MEAFLYDETTYGYLRKTMTDLDPLESNLQGKKVWLVPRDGTLDPIGPAKDGCAQVYKGHDMESWPYDDTLELASQGEQGAWYYIEDHRQHMDEKGTKQGGTPYWLPAEGDDWQSPPRYTEELGPLPEGAVTERPEKPAPTLDEAKTDAVKKVDNATSAAILAGFDYEADPGTGTAESLHFSYDTFDQQNFADSANVATLAMSGVEGLPTSVTWNAYRNWTTESGGELVRLTLTPATFLELYTAGALTHKATQMEIGGARKEAVEAAESAEAVQAMLAQWGL